MIDRTRPLLPLNPRWIGGSALVSLAVFLALPALALITWLVGMVVCLLLWLVVLVVYLVVFLLVIGGALALIGGLGLLMGSKSKRDEGLGMIVLGGLALALGVWGSGQCGTAAQVLDSLARGAATLGWACAGYCVFDLWLGLGVVTWSWAPLAATLLLALGLLTAVGLLRCHDRALGPLWRIYLACPRGHRSGAVFGCPGCGEWEPRLVPSVYGILTACCECGRDLPTSHLNGRTRLPKRCAACSETLDYPDLGARAEYHVAVWGSAEAGKSAWLRSALDGAVAAGARLVERGRSGNPDAPAALPARILGLERVGRNLLYLYDIPDDECLAGEQPARQDYQHWLDAVVLVLSLSPRDLQAPGDATHLRQERTISALLDRWDRLHVGRTRGRHRAPAAVVVRWQGPGPVGVPAGDAPSARVALERAGYGPTILALEARFRCVEYFTLTSPRAEARSTDGRPERPLEWLDQAL